MVEISLKFVPGGPIAYIPTLVQMMVRYHPEASHYLNRRWLVYWRIQLTTWSLVWKTNGRLAPVCLTEQPNDQNTLPLIITSHTQYITGHLLRTCLTSTIQDTEFAGFTSNRNFKGLQNTEIDQICQTVQTTNNVKIIIQFDSTQLSIYQSLLWNWLSGVTRHYISASQ